jgi:broad specificity phosphatase PhoE
MGRTFAAPPGVPKHPEQDKAMRISAAEALSTLLACGLAWMTATVTYADDTVFFVVRHAEKASESGDPDLSEEGRIRAKQLAQTLEHLNVDAIYRTNTLRSKMTAEPLATTRNITPKVYENVAQAWIDAVVAEQTGKRVLIVAHSNTVDVIVNGLTGASVPAIGDHYDNLFVVVVSEDGKKSVLRLRYGQPH